MGYSWKISVQCPQAFAFFISVLLPSVFLVAVVDVQSQLASLLRLLALSYHLPWIFAAPFTGNKMNRNDNSDIN